MMNKISIFALLILASVAFGCSMFKPDLKKSEDLESPTDAYRSFTKSIQTTDPESMKRLMSKGTIEMMEKAAKKRDMTIDQFLIAIRVKKKYEPKLRNEKIKGDTATLEEKNDAFPGWDTVILIREDGRWKYAGDKTLEARSK